jgi:hypothetical protein
LLPSFFLISIFILVRSFLQGQSLETPRPSGWDHDQTIDPCFKVLVDLIRSEIKIHTIQ